MLLHYHKTASTGVHEVGLEHPHMCLDTSLASESAIMQQVAHWK